MSASCVVELDDIQGRNLHELRVITTFDNLLRVDVALADTLTVLSETNDDPVVNKKKATVTGIRFFVEPALQQQKQQEQKVDEADRFQLQLIKDVRDCRNELKPSYTLVAARHITTRIFCLAFG